MIKQITRSFADPTNSSEKRFSKKSKKSIDNFEKRCILNLRQSINFMVIFWGCLMVKRLLHILTVGFLIICLMGLPYRPVHAAFDEGMGYNFGSSASERLSFYDSKKNPVFKRTFLSYLEEYKDACWFCTVFVGEAKSDYENKTGISEEDFRKLCDPYMNPSLTPEQVKEQCKNATEANYEKVTTYSGGLYDAINKLTKTIFNTMSLDFLKLMGVGILFLILFKVGKMLVQLQEVDVMQFLNDLFKPLGRAIIATALLGMSVAVGHQTIFYLITNPVLSASIRIGEKVLDTTLGDVQILKTEQSEIDSKLQDNIKQNIKWEELDTKAEKENAQQGGDTPLEESIRFALLQWMKSVSSSFIVGIALGGSFTAVGFDSFFSAGGLSMTLAGIIIWLGFWIIYLMFPFKIIDAFVRLSIVLALMPLWIILWVFPATQQYTKKAWEMFLSSCLLFAVLSIMIAICLMLISNVVPDPLYSANGSIRRSEFFRMLCTEDTLNNAVKYAGFGSGLCMNALAFSAMSFALISSAATIANSFVGGGGNIQTNVGNSMASTAAQAGRVGWSAAKATGKAGAWGLGKAHDAWTNRGSRHTATGTFGGATGNNGNNNNGGTPPPNNPPPNTDEPRSEGRRDDTSAPEGTDVRYNPNRPAFEQLPPRSQDTVANRAAAQETALYDAKDDPAKRRSLIDDAGPEQRRALKDMERDIKNNDFTKMGENRTALKEAIAKDILKGQDPETLRRQSGEQSGDRRQGERDNRSETEMTPERKKAVQELAKDATAPQKFEKLSADVAFIEQSLSKDRDTFMQDIKAYDKWQSGDAKTMQSFAEQLYNAKDKPNSAEHAVKGLLSPHLETTAGWNTGNQIADKVGAAVKSGGIGHTLSDQLKSLSMQITEARTNRR